MPREKDEKEETKSRIEKKLKDENPEDVQEWINQQKSQKTTLNKRLDINLRK